MTGNNGDSNYHFVCHKGGASRAWTIRTDSKIHAQRLCELDLPGWYPPPGVGYECVASGTNVVLPDGQLRKVEKLKPGSELLVGIEYPGEVFSAPITSIVQTTHDSCVELDFDGEVVRVSGSQPIVTECGVIDATNLFPGAKVVSFDRGRTSRDTSRVLKSAMRQPVEVKTYSIYFEQTFFFFVGNSRAAMRCKF